VLSDSERGDELKLMWLCNTAAAARQTPVGPQADPYGSSNQLNMGGLLILVESSTLTGAPSEMKLQPAQ
jgi:hypothetical protein